ncbi:MAG: NADH-quinone oxidoreductase subunit NuoF [Chloroflexi bacterium]|nr:NADH-quinone oxidoreductase subunit NuoF [Chloroflexota bacterium]
MENILLRNRDVPDIHEFDVYEAHGGWSAFRKAVSEMSPDDVIKTVLDANLRGRGGAGFSTGRKWSFIPKDEPIKYVAVNADESEPGTFKDRELLEHNPYQVLEGSMLCAYAIQATAVYIYCRGEFWDIAANLDEAIEVLREKNLIGENILGTGWSCEVYTHLGAGAYICGEESAMLSSLQGLLGQPRVRPPFPAQKGGGLYYEATVVNNVETLANVPWIINNGPDAYKELGTPDSPGPKIFCVSGHVARPGNYELPLGETFRHLLFDLAGGPADPEKSFKALLPTGASGPVVPITEEMLDIPMTYENLIDLDSTLGSASFIVMEEGTDMVWAAYKMAQFFKHESCGKCTPCREGTFWLLQVMTRIIKGEGTIEDLATMENAARQMDGKSLCALGDFATSPILGTLKHYRHEYEAYIVTDSGAGEQKQLSAGKKAVAVKQ